MRTLIDPPKPPRQTAGNPGPKTLTEARERIETLEAQLLQLRGSATAPKPALTVPTDRPNTNQMAVNVPAPEKKRLPLSADTPFKITEILKNENLDSLLDLLSNPDHSPLQQSLIYQSIKEIRKIQGNRFQ